MTLLIRFWVFSKHTLKASPKLSTDFLRKSLKKRVVSAFPMGFWWSLDPACAKVGVFMLEREVSTRNSLEVERPTDFLLFPSGTHQHGNMAARLEYTLKTPRSDLTRKRVRGGQTHFGVRLIWNPGINYRNLSPKCLSDLDSGSVWLGFRVSLTWILGRSDPKMGLAPSDSFPGQIWPGSF